VFAAEDIVRPGVFVVVFVAMALWEWLKPRRAQSVERGRRWPANLGIAALNVFLVRVASPITVVGVAVAAQTSGWGLVNVFALPAVPGAILSFAALDLVIFAQHVVFHRVALLWRLHRVHHADLEFDVTTGLRFHPGEMVISLVVKMTAVLILGASPLVVLCFEVVLNATSMFNHGNVRLALALDRWLRRVLVTPDMHRVHHSLRGDEMNSNFGFNLPWWDRLFGTYRAQPADGHDAMKFGIDQFRATGDLLLGSMLRQPWLSPSTRR
jgi:sterol desaturase/sphingolipid hydroxylase (fatty acid hydroxylase superfamily)